MIDFTGALVILGLVATAFVGGIVIGYLVALRQAQSTIKRSLAGRFTRIEKETKN